MEGCDVPGWPDQRLYGTVPEEELPWYHQEPLSLQRLRQQLPAPKLVAAFRTTVKEPLFDEIHNVAHAANLIAGSVVRPGEIFSINDRAGPYVASKGYKLGPGYMAGAVVPVEGGGVCKVATVLYNLARISDLTVIERHPHSMLVPYIPPGRDAAVAFGSKDMRFKNDTGGPLLIWSQMVDNTVFVAFYGQHQPPAVEWHYRILYHEPPATVRRPNPQLATNEEQVVINGLPGVTVATWLTITYPGEESQRRDLGVDYYRPLPKVVEYGP